MKKVFAALLAYVILQTGLFGCAPQPEQPNPAPDTDVTEQENETKNDNHVEPDGTTDSNTITSDENAEEPTPDTDEVADDGGNTPAKDMSTDENGSDAQNNKVENSSDELDKPNSDEAPGIVDQDDQHKGNEEPSPDEKPKTNEDIGQSDSETNDIESSENGTEIYTNLSDFLTEEQIAIHDKAAMMYFHLIGQPGYYLPLDDIIDDSILQKYPSSVTDEETPEMIKINTVQFYRMDGKIRTIMALRSLYLSVFTEENWERENFSSYFCIPRYMEINGRLYYWGLQGLPATSARDPEYELLSFTEKEIVYNTIQYKTIIEDAYMEGEELHVISRNEIHSHLNKLVLTDDGWRYEEFWDVYQVEFE